MVDYFCDWKEHMFWMVSCSEVQNYPVGLVYLENRPIPSSKALGSLEYLGMRDISRCVWLKKLVLFGIFSVSPTGNCPICNPTILLHQRSNLTYISAVPSSPPRPTRPCAATSS